MALDVTAAAQATRSGATIRLTWAGVGSYSYNAAVSGCSDGTPATKPHAVAQVGSSIYYRYDCNGNMTERAGQTLRYDAENRLAQVVGEAVTAYRYNGDGQRVSLTTGCTTTTYVGNYFEWTGSAATMTSYYYAGGTRVAMRTGTPLTGTVNYLVGDHLGSSSVSYRSDGGQTATQRYFPWGTIRPGPDNALPTDYTFTGQKLDASAGLLYYGARYYDSALGRFIQADTLVPQPGNPQSLNRYSYVLNNPIKYRDPNGHVPIDWVLDIGGIAFDVYQLIREPSPENRNALAVDLGLWALPYTPAVAGLALRTGKVAAKIASHADEAVDAARLAGHMGDGVHAALSASKLAQAGTHADEAAKLVKALAEGGTRGTFRKGVTVSLGHFSTVSGVSGYADWAKVNGAVYLQVDQAAYEILDKAGKWWDVNKQFLNNAADAGAKFHLQFENAQWASDFQREMDYLINDRGYVKKFISGEWWLVAP